MYSKLSRKILPERTEHFQNERGDRMWMLLKHCWDYDPGARPTAYEVLDSVRVLTYKHLR